MSRIVIVTKNLSNDEIERAINKLQAAIEKLQARLAKARLAKARLAKARLAKVKRHYAF